jgi:SanA protein
VVRREEIIRAAVLAWRVALGAGALFVLGVALFNLWVVRVATADLYTNWAALPQNEVGLVLGTSSFTTSGAPNPYFAGRIAAAVELYQLGKVKHLIVSGANPDATYNEPRRMWQALTAAGVPAQAITMDFAGLRTFDSMARAISVFRLTHVTVITQEYHAYRALFIARKLGLQAVAYAPVTESFGPALKPQLREMLARARAVLDLYLLGTEPRFAGEPEPLPGLQPEQGNTPPGFPPATSADSLVDKSP